VSICPLEYRYGSEEMRKILCRESFLERLVEVELALIKALEEVGIAPKGCSGEIAKLRGRIKPKDIDELEKKLGHDIASLAILLAELSGECGKYVHLGATSYDIVDTAWALVLRDALKIIKRKLKEVIEKLTKLSRKYENLLMVGRTHGQHALPITFGFKLANYVYEFSRSYERISELEERLIKCKMSGAVGTMAAWGDKGLQVEYYVCKELNLKPHLISTQIAPRDGFAELISSLAILGSQLDRLALEIRELSRPEISEITITYAKIGSSTMPHKKNPTVAERISGLAKVVRALAITAFENIPLMHERDLTNSSSERIIIPHTLLIVDQMLTDTLNMISNLNVSSKAMKRNLEVLHGVIMSECLMTKLVLKANMYRHKAHELLTQLSNKALAEKRSFKEVVLESNVSSMLPVEDIEECFNYEAYLGKYRELIERTLNYAKEVLGGNR